MKGVNLVKSLGSFLFFISNSFAFDTIKHVHTASCSHSSVPEPSSLLLIAAGVAGIAGYRKFKNRKNK